MFIDNKIRSLTATLTATLQDFLAKLFGRNIDILNNNARPVIVMQSRAQKEGKPFDQSLL